MEEYTHKVQLEDFLGLDLTSNDLKRPDNFLTGGKNFDIDDNGDLVTRRGFRTFEPSQSEQLPAQSANFFGLGNTSPQGQIEGNIKSELIFLGENPKKLLTHTMTVTATGVNYRLEVYYDTSSSLWKFRVSNFTTGSVLLDYDISNNTYLSLQSAINAVSGLSATFSSGFPTSKIARYMMQDNKRCGTGYPAYFYTYSRTNISKGSDSSKSFVPGNYCSTSLINNCLFFTDVNGLIWKYDGQSYYQSGLPKPTLNTIISIPKGPISTGIHASTETFAWKCRIVHRDNAGNYIYSQFSDVVQKSINANNLAEITVSFNMDSTTYYKDRYARFSPVSISLIGPPDEDFDVTVTSNTMEVGDLVFWPNQRAAANYLSTSSYFLQQVSNPINPVNDYGFGRVKSIAGSTVTITRKSTLDQVGGLDLAEINSISAGVWLEIYRTQRKTVDPGLVTFYLAGAIPVENDITKVIVDGWADDGAVNISQNPIAPDVTADFGAMAPACRHLTTYRGRLIAAGDIQDPNLVHFSEAGFQENFPTATNSFTTDTEFGDGVVGLFGDQEALVIAKDHTYHRVIGDLGGSFSVDRFYTGINVVSHNSIANIGDQRSVFLTKKGLYQIIRSSVIVPLMPIQGPGGGFIDRLAGFFDGFHASESGDKKLVFEMATAQTYPEQNKYILTIPVAANYDGNVTNLSDIISTVFIVYDYKRGHYSLWEDFTSYGGFRIFKRSETDTRKLLFFCKRGVSNTTSQLSAFSNTYLPEDFIDDLDPIVSQMKFNWLHLGRPDTPKKFIRGSMWVLGADPSTLTLTAEANWKDGIILTNVDLESDDKSNVIFKFAQQRAKSMRLSIAHAEKLKQMRLTGFTLEIAAAYKPKVEQ